MGFSAEGGVVYYVLNVMERHLIARLICLLFHEVYVIALLIAKEVLVRLDLIFF